MTRENRRSIFALLADHEKYGKEYILEDGQVAGWVEPVRDRSGRYQGQIEVRL